MRGACVLARPFVVLAGVEGRPIPGAAGEHVGRCLRCQALAARTRASARALRSLATLREPVPSGLLPGVFAALEPRRGSRIGWSSAAAGGAVVVAMLLLRRRPAPV